MIDNNGKYYLYRHIRHDKNIPFYIGVGQKENNGYKRITTEYRRAFVHFTRNKYWKSIVSNTSYSVEILVESDDRDFIISKEKEFISLYGRKDTSGGILCNMTDGGDYYNKAIKYKNQGRNNLSTSKRSEITKLSKRHKLGTNPVEIFVYDKLTGCYITSYPQIKMAATELGLRKNEISDCMSKRVSYKDYLFSRVNMGDKINISTFRIKRLKSVPVVKIDSETKLDMCRYSSAVEASKDVGVSNSNIQQAIKNTNRCGGFYWRYDNGEPFVHIQKRKSRDYQNVNRI